MRSCLEFGGQKLVFDIRAEQVAKCHNSVSLPFQANGNFSIFACISRRTCVSSGHSNCDIREDGRIGCGVTIHSLMKFAGFYAHCIIEWSQWRNVGIYAGYCDVTNNLSIDSVAFEMYRKIWIVRNQQTQRDELERICTKIEKLKGPNVSNDRIQVK